MDELDNLIPDVLSGLEDEKEDQLFGDAAKFFSDALLRFNEFDDSITDEDGSAEERAFEIDHQYEEPLPLSLPSASADDAVVVITDDSGVEIISDPFGGLDERALAVTSGDSIVQLNTVPLSVSLEKYGKILSDVTIRIGSQNYNNKASKEISRRLIEFYESHNDILPDIALTNEFYLACDEIQPGMNLRDKYKHSNIDTYIIKEIQNGRSVQDITSVLKAFVKRSHIVDGRNRRFLINPANEIKVRQFLSKLKVFYESDLATYDRNMNRKVTALADVYTGVNYLLKLDVQDDPESEVSLTYPQKIYLDSGTFICGNCGSEQEYAKPFFGSVLINASSDDFLMLYPTVEVCTDCGFNNVLSANYYEVLATRIKEIFKQRGDITILREKLEKLSGDFSKYSYTLPKAVIIEALPPGLKSYFEDRGQQQFIVAEEKVQCSIDPKQSAKLYRERVSSLAKSAAVNRPVYNTSAANHLLHEGNVIDRSVAARGLSTLAKMFCSTLGTSYGFMKDKAVNSLLFFLYDYVPFITNPFVVVREYAMKIVGLQDEAEFNKIVAEYKVVSQCLEDSVDYFVFTPIVMSNSAHPQLEQFSHDVRMRAWLDYVSDAMILFHMRNDLIDLCTMGKRSPFSTTKAKLDELLRGQPFGTSVSRFSRALNAASDNYLVSLDGTQRSWLYNKQLACGDHKELFKALLEKDIYAVVKIVSRDERYADIRPEIEEFAELVANKNKLEFFYGDLFPNENLSERTAVDIPSCFIIEPEEGETLDHYLSEIRSMGVRTKKAIIKHRDWFSDHVKWFFNIFQENILASSSCADVLFMDILKNLTAYDAGVLAQLFNHDEKMLALALTSDSDFEFPVFDRDKELAKLVLYLYPYKSLDLRVLVSECEDNVDSAVAAVLADTEALEEELLSAPAEVRNLLMTHFDLEP